MKKFTTRRTGGGMPVMLLILLKLLLAAPAFANITWTAPGNANGAAIRLELGRLCRGTVNNQVLVGYESSASCVLVTEDRQVHYVSSYQLAIGLAKWQDINPPNSTPLVAGEHLGIPIRPCRPRVGLSRVGWNRAIDNVCYFVDRGFLRTSTEFDLLYPFDLAERYQIVAQDGKCVTTDPLPTDTWVYRAQCASNGFQMFRLEPSGFGKYVVRSVPRGDCLLPGSGIATVMGSCQSGVSQIEPEYVNEEIFRLRFLTGTYLDADMDDANWLSNLDSIFLKQKQSSASDSQHFRLRSIPDAARQLKVMSYNVMLLSGLVFPGIKHKERVDMLVPRILSRYPDLDVIMFQEVFDETARGRLQSKLSAAGFPYFTELPTMPLYDDPGVYIQSKYPIEFQIVDPFPVDMCSGSDCLANKGVVYARINKFGRRYHLFNTHLQAGDDSQTRRDQLQEIRNFTQILPMLSDEPVLIGGDLNIDMEGEVYDYNYMLSTLRANFPNAPRVVGVPSIPTEPRYTSDSRTNDIKQARGGNENKWLDYILAVNRGPQPTSVSWEAHEFQTTERYGMNLEIAPVIIPIGGLAVYLNPTSWHFDLSDHYSLVGKFTFPYGTAQAVEDNTVPVEFVSQRLPDSDELPEGTEVAITVNGTQYPLPTTLRLRNDASYTINAVAPEPLNGTRFLFQGWNTGAGQGWVLSNLTRAETFKAQFLQQHEVKIASNPAIGGSVTGAGWHSIGSRVTLDATAAPGFRFVRFSGDLESQRNGERMEVTGPRNIVAHFEAVAAPTLYATSGQRTGSGSQRTVELVLKNVGAGPALNARITNITAAVTTGTGTVTLAQPVPISFGSIEPGAASFQGVSFQWPGTATRVRLTIRFSADNGYSGATTLNLFR